MESFVNYLNALLPSGLELGGNFIYTLLILLATIVSVIISRVVLKILGEKAAQTAHWWDDAFVLGLKVPIQAFLWVFGISYILELSFLGAGSIWANDISMARGVFSVVIISWGLLKSTRYAELNYRSRKRKVKGAMDATTASAISKVLRIIIFIIAALFVIQSFGVSLAGVLAAGGVGGLAIGFASKDLLANFFGALMIYMDKPFAVGDWIRSPDKQIEGTVEEIGWRVTKIITFDKRPLYVPNAFFTQISVENPSRMSNRRILENIGVRYDDLNVVENVITEIERMLRSHEDIDQNQTLFVHLNAFKDSSVEILIYCFTKTTEWVPYHAIKQDVLLKIAKIIEAQKAEIAFPTHTIHVKGGTLPATKAVKK